MMSPSYAEEGRMLVRDWCIVVGGAGLPVSRALPDPLPDNEWSSFAHAVRMQRLTGLALAAVASGTVTGTEEQLEELQDDHLEAMAIALHLEKHIVRVAELLEPHDIPFRVLKGSAVAHLDYPDPALRGFGDVDVLFRADDIDRAMAVLTGADYERVAPQAHDGFDRRFGKGATLIAADTYELDVHRTFAMGPYGYTVNAEDLWEDSETFRLAERDVHALGVEPRMLHACFHAVVGNPHARIQPHRDVAEMFLYGSYSGDRLLALAERWQALGVVARALTTTWDVLALVPEPPLLAWARGYVLTRNEVRMLSVYSAETSYAAKSLASLRVMSWRDRTAFVGMLATSGRGFARGRSRGHWLVRGTSRAIRDRTLHGFRKTS